MRRYAVLMVMILVLTGCGGSVGGEDDGGGSGDLADPCSLLGDDVLLTYFPEVPEPVRGNSGPVQHCTWSDENANSVLVQVDMRDSVFRPDPCDGCLDLDYADEGYASAVSLQATATFVVNGKFYSVSTTGMGDDVPEISALGELVLENDRGG